MAMMQKMAGAVPAEVAQAPVPAQVAAPVEGQAPKVANSKSGALYNKFKAEGASLRSQYSEDQKSVEGSKSDKIVFVGCLGDPAHPTTRRVGKEDVPTLRVVGYRFKALEDIAVPKANLKPSYTSWMDTEPAVEVPVKAGETFDLNVFETGVLISRPEFAGKFTGEGNTVYIGVKFSASREEPLPTLNKDEGSVKEVMLPVADMIPSETDPNASVPKIKAEFAEKFAIIYARVRADRKGTGSSSAVSKGETQANLAAAFAAYVSRKNA